jgi:hypothetical protein
MKALALALAITTITGSTPTRGSAQEPLAQNVRLTFHIIEADGFPDTDPAIAEIVAELREIFRFSGYRLLDTSVLRASLGGDMRDGDGAVFTIVRQRMTLAERGRFEIEAWVYQTRDPSAVRVAVRFKDEDGRSTDSGEAPILIDASVTTRSGQTVVLGSGRPSGPGGAFILAMNVQIDDAR